MEGLSGRRYRKDAVSGFLRDRRSGTAPDPRSPVYAPVSERRVPGMRREELAWAAGISVDYYVKLEQGRMLNPSPSVVSSIADALQLSDLDRRFLGHLFSDPDVVDGPVPAVVPDDAVGTLDLVASHFPDALMIHLLDHDLDLTLPDARTRSIMFPGVEDPPARLSLVDYMFAEPYRNYSRRVYVDWRDKAAEVIGLIHMKLATGAASSGLRATVAALLDDPAFRTLWRRYIPFENATGSWRMRICASAGPGGEKPGAGEDRIRDCPFVTVKAPDAPELSLVIYS